MWATIKNIIKKILHLFCHLYCNDMNCNHQYKKTKKNKK